MTFSWTPINPRSCLSAQRRSSRRRIIFKVSMLLMPLYLFQGSWNHLELWLDRHLNFSDHVITVARACNYHIWALRHIRHLLTEGYRAHTCLQYCDIKTWLLQCSPARCTAEKCCSATASPEQSCSGGVTETENCTCDTTFEVSPLASGR